MIEFAIILPSFFILVFAILYAGMMFMDYIQYSNAARYAARDIALLNDSDRTKIYTNFDENVLLEKYTKPLTSLYKPKFKKPEFNGDQVKIVIELERNDENFPYLLSIFDFPPKNLNPIEYKMTLEKSVTITTEQN